MSRTLIKLSWMQVLDYGSKIPLERSILDLSYNEFLVHLQSYELDGIKTWPELVGAFPKAELGLSYKAGLAFGASLAKAVGNKIPLLTDTLGLQRIPLDAYDFRILYAEMENRYAYRAALIYKSGWLTLLNHFGDKLLLSLDNTDSNLVAGYPETFLLGLDERLSIWSYHVID